MGLWANNEKPEKNLEGLKGVRNTMRRYSTPVFCCECKEPFDVKGKELVFRFCQDGSFDMICPSCHAKWEKHWEVKEVIEFIPNPTIFGTGVAKCRMADNRIYDHHYGLGNRNNLDMPDKFFEDFQKFHQANHDAKKALLIRTLEVRDTFAEFLIIVTQNNGNVTKLDFKTGVQGIVLNEKQVSKVDPVLFKGIIEKLREQHIYVKEIK